MRTMTDVYQADRWQAWARAYIEICQRIVDEATAKPGLHAASKACHLREYIDLLRLMAASEPTREDFDA